MKKIALILFLIPGFAFAEQPSPAAKQEITHLIAYLKDSGCKFNRNGTWYNSGEAAIHLNKKYQYLLKKDLVTSAEDFIAHAASESSITGKPYQVKCSASAPLQSGLWLKSELVKYRHVRQ
jgi:hypothetical protein